MGGYGGLGGKGPHSTLTNIVVRLPLCSNMKELFVITAKVRSFHSFSVGKELIEICPGTFSVSTCVISLKDVAGIHDILEEFAMNSACACFESLGTAMVKLLKGEAQVIVDDSDRRERPSFSLKFLNERGKVEVTSGAALAALLESKLKRLGEAPAKEWLAEYYKLMRYLDVLGQMAGQIRGTQWRNMTLTDVNNVQRSIRYFNWAKTDDGIGFMVVCMTEKYKLGVGDTHIMTNSVALPPTAAILTLLFTCFRPAVISGLKQHKTIGNMVTSNFFAEYIFVGDNGNLQVKSATSRFQVVTEEAAQEVTRRRRAKNIVGPAVKGLKLQSLRHVFEKVNNDVHEARESYRSTEMREATGRAIAGHSDRVAKNYTANEAFATSTFSLENSIQIPIVLAVCAASWEKIGLSNWFKGRETSKGPLVVKEGGTYTDTVGGLVGFVDGSQRETAVQKQERARRCVEEWLDKAFWQSRLACLGKEGRGEEDVMLYSVYQKEAIIEVLLQQVNKGKGGKHLFIELHCGEGKTAIALHHAIMGRFQLDVGVDRTMRHPTVMLFPNRNLLQDKFLECKERDLNVFKIMGGQGRGADETIKEANRVLLMEGNAGA